MTARVRHHLLLANVGLVDVHNLNARLGTRFLRARADAPAQRRI